ncbi:hypothetical protein [Haladaptatus sp. DYF46]|uniref:hypothetical protein n=1 Tax=Haladaptatus sp. DYF46 TaxID=2886041 RepID=UPI001E289FEE|nr:hypothetical protein [Haladaptatus sp. DYF46]
MSNTDDTPTVATFHENDRETGKQRTYRRVMVTDAAGNEYEHTFELLGDGTRRYVEDGDPSQAALDALDEWGATHADEDGTSDDGGQA